MALLPCVAPIMSLAVQWNHRELQSKLFWSWCGDCKIFGKGQKSQTFGAARWIFCQAASGGQKYFGLRGDPLPAQHPLDPCVSGFKIIYYPMSGTLNSPEIRSSSSEKPTTFGTLDNVS
jgi:hypothetical protein